MDPGLTDVFAAHAAKHGFDEVHEVHIRDGGDLEIPGFAFAPVFSIWTTIEECLNPPIVWEDGAWHTTEPFSAPESFPFPEGIGPVECVNVEHEEVVLIPRWVETREATFKYALGDDFIDKLKTIHALGMDRTDKVSVKGVEVAPRDVLAAITPDPISLGDKFRGRAVVGTWVLGVKDGKPRETFAYQMADAEETWRRYGLQVVGWQTGFNPVMAMELLANGAWTGAGVLGPEAFDPDPYLALLDRHGIHHADRRDGARGAPAHLTSRYSIGVMRSIVASSRARISSSSRRVSPAQAGSSSVAGAIGAWSARSWNG